MRGFQWVSPHAQLPTSWTLSLISATRSPPWRPTYTLLPTRLLTLIAEFDRLQGWEPEGHRSCAHWLAYRTGIDLGAAREKVRTARALKDLPQISTSMEQGELSFTQVRALTLSCTCLPAGRSSGGHIR